MLNDEIVKNKFAKEIRIAIKRMRIKSRKKKNEGGWNCKKKNSILKTIQNKTNSNQNNMD